MKRILASLLLTPLLLAAGIMVQDVFASSYTICDGGRTFAYTGFSNDPRVAVKHAGVPLEDGDAVIREGGTITVQRRPTVTLLWHGQSMTVPIQGETAAQLLRRLGLEITQEDVLSVPAQTLLWDGMCLQVDRVVHREECYTRSLPFETREVFSPQLPEGQRQILIAGREGSLKCRAWVTYVNGQETGRELLEESLTRNPITQIVAVGTKSVSLPKEKQPVILENELILPTGERVGYKKVDYVRATAYTHTDAGCTSTTATNTRVHRGTVAVDPRYIPYGTRMFIMASDGSYIYGLAEAEDCGGDIKGDRMDLYLPSYDECMAFGRRTCTVYFLE